MNPILAHDDADDMAEFGTKFNTAEGGYRLDTRRPFIPQGCDQQGRLTPTIRPCPAEACTEIGAEPKRREGLLGRIRRWYRIAELKASVIGYEEDLCQLQQQIDAYTAQTFPTNNSPQQINYALQQIQLCKVGILDTGRRMEETRHEIARLRAGGEF